MQLIFLQFVLIFSLITHHCMQINVYALGRAYLKLANALHINPPAIGTYIHQTLQLMIASHPLI